MSNNSLFPSFINGKIVKGILFTIPSVCESCILKMGNSCGQEKKSGFSTCRRGYTYYKSESSDIVYFGLKVEGFFDNKKCKKNEGDKNIPVLKKECFLSTISERDDSERNEVLLKRFFHDLGQYTSALDNLLPTEDDLKSEKEFSMHLKEVASISAFAKAISFFRRHYLHKFFNDAHSQKSRLVVFSPYGVFHKYKYCFETKEIKIDITKRGEDKFDDTIRVEEGFELIVLNLFSNAVKYIPKRGTHRDVHVTFDRDEEGGIKIKVSSFGPPVTLEELRRLGEYGYSTPKASSLSQGEGLGLNMINEYTAKSGISVSYSSDLQTKITEKSIDYCLFQALISIPVHLIVKSSKEKIY